jgi:hypothetical protein
VENSWWPFGHLTIAFELMRLRFAVLGVERPGESDYEFRPAKHQVGSASPMK